jgi:hypothetical protein
MKSARENRRGQPALAVWRKACEAGTDRGGRGHWHDGSCYGGTVTQDDNRVHRLVPLWAGLLLLLFSLRIQWGQGMLGRGATAMPRPKPAGRLFRARSPISPRPPASRFPRQRRRKRKKYIVESMGHGVAFFDYDNDGWWTFSW